MGAAWERHAMYESAFTLLFLLCFVDRASRYNSSVDINIYGEELCVKMVIYKNYSPVFYFHQLPS